MARKMYREAIEAYEQAPQNSAIIWNKMGIAYHQMVQLDARHEALPPRHSPGFQISGSRSTISAPYTTRKNITVKRSAVTNAR